MPDEESTHAKKGFTFYFLIILVLLFGYLFSPAPLAWCIEAISGNPGPQVKEIFRTVYAPIIYGMDNVSWIRAFYLWYFDLWGVH